METTPTSSKSKNYNTDSSDFPSESSSNESDADELWDSFSDNDDSDLHLYLQDPLYPKQMKLEDSGAKPSSSGSNHGLIEGASPAVSAKPSSANRNGSHGNSSSSEMRHGTMSPTPQVKSWPCSWLLSESEEETDNHSQKRGNGTVNSNGSSTPCHVCKVGTFAMAALTDLTKGFKAIL